jgi:hypothetical protein
MRSSSAVLIGRSGDLYLMHKSALPRIPGTLEIMTNDASLGPIDASLGPIAKTHAEFERARVVDSSRERAIPCAI